MKTQTYTSYLSLKLLEGLEFKKNDYIRFKKNSPQLFALYTNFIASVFGGLGIFGVLLGLSYLIEKNNALSPLEWIIVLLFILSIFILLFVGYVLVVLFCKREVFNYVISFIGGSYASIFVNLLVNADNTLIGAVSKEYKKYVTVIIVTFFFILAYLCTFIKPKS